MELNVETKGRKVKELEQWIMTLSNSMLVGNQGTQGSQDFQHQIIVAMTKLDMFLKENFDLKKDLAFEKKKYLDLMNAFLELRS
jgi:BMFP domain-containing protein YqiC